MPDLLICPPDTPQDATAAWDCAWASATGPLPEHRSSVLLNLPRDADAVVLVVPLARISWHRVTLPEGSLGRNGRANTRTAAVLAGLLEDRLLDDVAALHLALQPVPQTAAPVWVAAVDRAWVHAATQALVQAGLPPQRIVPEAAPQNTPTLWVTGTPQAPLAWMTWPDGAVTAAALSADSPLPQTIDGEPASACAEPAVAAVAERWLGHPVQVGFAAQRWWPALQSQWDLAQFDLAALTQNR